MKRPATARSRSKDSYASNESGGLSLQNGAAGSGIGNSDGSSSPKRIGMRRASGSAMVALAAAKKWNQSSRTAAHGSGASATPRAVRFSSNKGVSDVGLSALTAQATLHPSFFQHGDAANLQSSGGVEASAASNSQLSEALAKLGNVFTLSDLVEAGVLSQSRAMQYASEKVGNSARAMIKGGLPENTDDEPCTPVPFNKDRVLTIWDLSDLICRKDFRAWGVAEVKPPTTGEAQESKRASVRGSIRGSHRGSLLKAGNLGKGEEPVNADGGSSLSSSGDSSGSGSEHQNDEEVSETLRRISLFQLPSQYRGAGKVSRGAALWKRGALKISVAAAMRGSSKDTLPPSDDQSSSPVGTPGSKGVRNSLLDMVKNAPPRGSGSSPSSARRSLKPGEPGSPHKEPGTQKSPRGAVGKRVTTFPRGESPSQSSDRSPSPAGSPKVPPPPPPCNPTGAVELHLGVPPPQPAITNMTTAKAHLQAWQQVGEAQATQVFKADASHPEGSSTQPALEVPSLEHFQALLHHPYFVQAFEQELASGAGGSGSSVYFGAPRLSRLLADRPEEFSRPPSVDRLNEEFISGLSSTGGLGSRAVPALPEDLRVTV
mmetsp:Transcript_22615/g.39781  ORF Transcript_22615/g.39781 Transcript_22615/m.39781 type:complete len:601 (-) Transcript_22615:62-1864(-)